MDITSIHTYTNPTDVMWICLIWLTFLLILEQNWSNDNSVADTSEDDASEHDASDSDTSEDDTSDSDSSDSDSSYSYTSDSDSSYSYTSDSDSSEDESTVAGYDEYVSVPVFRYMNGSSCYILDDDDEIVIVHPDVVPIRISKLLSIAKRHVTRTHPTPEALLCYEDIYGNTCSMEFTNFYDTFERDKFIEFMLEQM